MERQVNLSSEWTRILQKREKARARTQEILAEHQNGSTCTYPLGYTGQELFHCRTCDSSAQGHAICFACYVSCHIEHDAV